MISDSGHVHRGGAPAGQFAHGWDWPCAGLPALPTCSRRGAFTAVPCSAASWTRPAAARSLEPWAVCSAAAGQALFLLTHSPVKPCSSQPGRPGPGFRGRFLGCCCAGLPPGSFSEDESCVGLAVLKSPGCTCYLRVPPPQGTWRKAACGVRAPGRSSLRLSDVAGPLVLSGHGCHVAALAGHQGWLPHVCCLNMPPAANELLPPSAFCSVRGTFKDACEVTSLFKSVADPFPCPGFRQARSACGPELSLPRRGLCLLASCPPEAVRLLLVHSGPCMSMVSHGQPLSSALSRLPQGRASTGIMVMGLSAHTRGPGSQGSRCILGGGLRPGAPHPGTSLARFQRECAL